MYGALEVRLFPNKCLNVDLKNIEIWVSHGLKEALRERNLPTSGSKTELIQRLTDHDPDVWGELRQQREEAEVARIAAEEEAREWAEHLAQIERDAALARNTAGNNVRTDCESNETASETAEKDREIELLKRERDLARREIELLRREQSLGVNHATNGVSSVNSELSAEILSSASVSIRSIGELLSPFDATDNSFWRWKQQITLLRTTYHLDDNTTRVLISSKLKGRASIWFHSKSEHLQKGVNDLLKEMETMFDHRPGKLAQRREFEARVWQHSENFCDYYHDKLILGNRVPISEEEIVDYIVDGIPDEQIQNQARIQCFKEKADLLKAFEKISLGTKKTYEPRMKKDTKGQAPPSQEEKPLLCYNCSGTGHFSKNCTKPRRTVGACFKCNSTEDQLSDCPSTSDAQAFSGQWEADNERQ